MLALGAGRGHLAFRAASSMPDNTVVSLAWGAQGDKVSAANNAAAQVALASTGGVDNLLVCQGTLSRPQCKCGVCTE